MHDHKPAQHTKAQRIQQPPILAEIPTDRFELQSRFRHHLDRTGLGEPAQMLENVEAQDRVERSMVFKISAYRYVEAVCGISSNQLLDGVVHGTGVQDRDGAPRLIGRSCDAYPTLARVFADGGYAGPKLEATVEHIDRLTIKIIRRSDLAGFVVLPRRWVVERTLAWLNRCRRLAKDWEVSIASSEAWMVISSIRRISRRTAKLELCVGLSQTALGLHGCRHVVFSFRWHGSTSQHDYLPP